MKKIKFLEKITAIFIVFLCFFTIYGLAYGGSLPIANLGGTPIYSASAFPQNETNCTYPSTPTVNYPWSPVTSIIPVNIISDSFEMLIGATCGQSLSATIYKIDTDFSLIPSQAVRVVSSIDSSYPNYGYYLKFPAGGLQTGRYALKMTNYYITKSTTVGINPPILMDITKPTTTITNPTNTTTPTAITNTQTTNTGSGQTTTGTSSTTTASGANTTTTPNTNSTDTVTVDSGGVTSVNGEKLTWSEMLTYVQKKIAEVDEAKLPAELREAPVSLNVNVQKSEIISYDVKGAKGKVRLLGKGEPNSKLVLYVFSSPIVITVETDVNGDWVYELEEDLGEGEHEAYVAVMGDEGKINAKSSPFSFFVSEALAAAGGAKIQNQTKNPNFALYYAIGSFGVLAVVVSALFFLVTKSHIKKHVEATQTQS